MAGRRRPSRSPKSPRRHSESRASPRCAAGTASRRRAGRRTGCDRHRPRRMGRRFGADPEIVGRAVQLGSTRLRHRRRDAGRVCVPAQSQFLDPVAPRCVGVRAAQRPERERLRPARAGRDDRKRAGGARPRSANASPPASPATHATPAAARAAVHLRVQRHGRSRRTRSRSARFSWRSCCCSSWCA